MKRLILRSLICVFFLGALAQCGKKTKSALVDIELTPHQPIVITGDTQIGDTTVKAPWFQFQVKLTNHSTENLVITTVVVDVTGTDSNGNTVTKTVSFSPGELNYSTNNVNCTYNFNYQDIGPGDSTVLTAINPDTVDCRTPVAQVFYADSNPSGDIHYSLKVKPEGWFGTTTDPSDRFDRTGYFFTQ